MTTNRFGSTSEVDFWTSKRVKEVLRSHVNYIVMDTKRWEQSATYYIDCHKDVAAFVENQGLGFAIPYLHNGQAHDYIPDFLIRLEDGTNLILETKGHDDLAEVKVAAARRWVDAVNAETSRLRAPLGRHWRDARNEDPCPHSLRSLTSATSDQVRRLLSVGTLSISSFLSV